MSLRRIRHRADTPLRYRIVAILLRYPDEQMLALLDDVAAALPAVSDRADRRRLAEVADWLGGLAPGEAAQRYVDTFDHTRRCCLYLTYYRHGDTRNRGMALLTLKDVYRRAGHEPPRSELPDHLSVILEFASLAPEPGHQILLQHRAGLELLRLALHEAATPYAALLDVVCHDLPELRARQRDAVLRLAAEGPPAEQVGLAPFGPPELLTSPAHLTGEPR